MYVAFKTFITYFTIECYINKKNYSLFVQNVENECEDRLLSFPPENEFEYKSSVYISRQNDIFLSFYQQQATLSSFIKEI